MTAKERLDRGWCRWRKAKNILDAILAEMQRVTPLVAEEPPVPIPAHTIADMRRNIRRFEEQFNMLVHEQQSRKAAQNV